MALEPWKLFAFLIEILAQELYNGYGSCSEGTGKVDINSWLTGNVNQSNSGGRAVEIPNNDPLNFSNWYAFEGSYGVSTLKDRDGLIVIENKDGSVVNEYGRHWICVGPKILNPDYPGNGRIWEGADGLDFGTNVDVKIKNEETEEILYIYAVVGDIKAHTFDNGIVQTGEPYPNSYNATPEGYVDPGMDRSSVEFIRTQEPTNLSQYSIVEIIAYGK